MSSFSWSTIGRISFSQLFFNGVWLLRNACYTCKQGYESVRRTPNATNLLYSLQPSNRLTDRYTHVLRRQCRKVWSLLAHLLRRLVCDLLLNLSHAHRRLLVFFHGGLVFEWLIVMGKTTTIEEKPHPHTSSPPPPDSTRQKRREQKEFPHRESNPDRQGESLLS